MAKLLRLLGWQVDGDNTVLTIAPPTGKAKPKLEAPYELVKTMRASVLVLGPLVARYAARGYRCRRLRDRRPADRPAPEGARGHGRQGCARHGYVDVECKRLRGAIIALDVPTVTGCEI